MTPPRPRPTSTTSAYAVMGSIWVVCDGHAFLGRGRVSLLEKIASTGSISQAAKHMGMSYRKAWRLVDTMNSLATHPLVIRTSGGLEGGGTKLTPHGQQLVTAFRSLESAHQTFLDKMAIPSDL